MPDHSMAPDTTEQRPPTRTDADFADDLYYASGALAFASKYIASQYLPARQWANLIETLEHLATLRSEARERAASSAAPDRGRR